MVHDRVLLVGPDLVAEVFDLEAIKLSPLVQVDLSQLVSHLIACLDLALLGLLPLKDNVEKSIGNSMAGTPQVHHMQPVQGEVPWSPTNDAVDGVAEDGEVSVGLLVP